MDRYAIFVDAGYFYSAGAQACQGHQISRKFISLKSPDTAVSGLCNIASALVGGMQLLRAYWYDAMPGPRLSLEQSSVAVLPYVKLRLGVLNNVGEQKGVDSLIVTDLIELARNRAVADAVIVSGDEDLRIAVQVAQSFGVRVHVLAAGDPKSNVSAALQMEADSVGSISDKWFAEHFSIATPAKPATVVPIASKASSAPVAHVPVAASAPGDALDALTEKISQELLGSTDAAQVAALQLHFTTSSSVPPEFDGRLVAKVAANLGRRLTGDEMRRIRGIFVKAVRAAKT